jgi:dihydrofolate reductase
MHSSTTRAPDTETPGLIAGERLREWVVGTAAFRERHGERGGEGGVDSDVTADTIRNIGATVMGRNMFSGGEGPWESDPSASGWWGDDPPVHHPVFVLTHHAREPLAMKGGTTFTFVTTGIEDALEQARAAAGGEDVAIGGADVGQQYLRAGLVDEFRLHVVPVCPGEGTRLLEGLPDFTELQVERTRVLESPTGVIHARYRVLKRA